MGSKGVIAIFDGGLHDFVFPDFAQRQFEERSLHPIQFKEIFVKLTYKTSLSLRIPFYGIIQDKEIDKYGVGMLAFDDYSKGAGCIIVGTEDGDLISMHPVLPESILDGPAYGEWSEEEFAHIMFIYTGIPVEDTFVPPDQARTFLRDAHGNFREIPL
jgi:hypothetical protein